MQYEMTIAMPPDLPAEKSKKMMEEVATAVEKSGGKLAKTESLGVKTLAYPIKSFSQASFGRFTLEFDPEKVRELRHQLEREETLLRVFVVKTEGGEVKSHG